MLLANKRTQKQRKIARSLFFKLKSILEKNIKGKNRLNLE